MDKEELQIIANMVVKITALKLEQTRHLAVQEFAPNLFKDLLQVWDEVNIKNKVSEPGTYEKMTPNYHRKTIREFL